MSYLKYLMIFYGFTFSYQVFSMQYLFSSRRSRQESLPATGIALANQLVAKRSKQKTLAAFLSDIKESHQQLHEWAAKVSNPNEQELEVQLEKVQALSKKVSVGKQICKESGLTKACDTFQEAQTTLETLTTAFKEKLGYYNSLQIRVED